MAHTLTAQHYFGINTDDVTAAFFGVLVFLLVNEIANKCLHLFTPPLKKELTAIWCQPTQMWGGSIPHTS